MARKTKDTAPDPLHGGKVHVPRSRGAVSGFLLLILGAWGALIPFIGPYFSFGYTPGGSWHWTSARGWLEVLPGAVVVLGAVLLLASTNRITASVGGWLAVAGGAWFVVGANFGAVFNLGSLGQPRGTNKGQRLLESLALFDGLGALILFLAAGAVGRLSVRSVRDVRAAQRREVEEEAEERRANAYQEERRRELAKRLPSDSSANDDLTLASDDRIDDGDVREVRQPAVGTTNGFHAQPNNAQPNTAQPNNAQPNSAQPNTAQPNTAQPNTAQPNTLAANDDGATAFDSDKDRA